jgi:hypothetical protein
VSRYDDQSWLDTSSICGPAAPNPARRNSRAVAIHRSDCVDTPSSPGYPRRHARVRGSPRSTSPTPGSRISANLRDPLPRPGQNAIVMPTSAISRLDAIHAPMYPATPPMATEPAASAQFKRYFYANAIYCSFGHSRRRAAAHSPDSAVRGWQPHGYNYFLKQAVGGVPSYA